MAPKKKAPADAPRGKRTSAAAFSALALLSGRIPARSDTASPAAPAAKKKAAPKKKAVPVQPPPAPSATVSGRPKPTLQRERQDKPAVGEAVRVWWPPTRDPAKTGFSGAYWPARVVPGPTGGAPGAGWCSVRYDNGEKGRALLDDLFPAQEPVAFGGERDPVKAGEFIEVHNGSDSDPCAWFGVARKVARGEAVVGYPFHDAEDEAVPLGRVRRARVWEGGAWMLPRPGQRWRPGEVTSPRELELVAERDYNRAGQASSAASGGGGGGGGGGSGGGAGAKKAAAAAVAAAPKKKATKAPAAKAPPQAKKKAPAVSVKAAAQKAKPAPKAKKAAAAGKRPTGRPPKK